MYTKIETVHGLQTLESWPILHQQDLPADFPTLLVMQALELVM